jgi:hypothetical protein
MASTWELKLKEHAGAPEVLSKNGHFIVGEMPQMAA